MIYTYNKHNKHNNKYYGGKMVKKRFKYCKYINKKKLTELMDNEISNVDKNRLYEHLDSCSKCREKYRGMLESMDIIGSIKNDRDNFVSNIKDEEKDLAVNNVIDAIKNDSYVSSKNQNKALSGNRPKRVFAGAIAGICIVVFAIMIIGVSRDFGVFNFMVHTGESEEQEIAYDDKTAIKAPEENQVPRGEKERTAAESVPGQEDEKSDFVDEEVAFISMKIYDFLPEYSYTRLDAKMRSVLNYFETKNNAYEYIGLFAYPSNETHSIASGLEEILDNAEIKIITGENSQKLLEYISVSEKESLLHGFEQLEADFVIILIGR